LGVFYFFRSRHSVPGPRVRRADLRLEPLESRLTPSTIDWNQMNQTIDGFGASSAWVVPSLTPARANLLFSPTQGIGLSLVRSRILPDTSASSAEVSTMQTAQNMGVTVFSTPWSPPAAWKDNGSVNNGGHLLASHYQDYADLLSQYVSNMQAAGITIHAVSIANEPDFTASYESSRWTASEFAAFLPVLADTFARDGVTAQIMLPEESGWRFDLASDIFANPALLADVGIVAAHNYGGSPAPVPQAQGKGLWETEVSSFQSFDPGITNALGWAKNIHDFMTIAHANAWNYWWLKSSGNDNEGLLGPNWELTKRLWAVGNYSRFVRPGWVNIGATDDGGVSVSAFKDPVSGQFAIVAVNQGNAVSKSFALSGFTSGAVTPWVTSDGLDLAQQGDIATDGSSFTANLPAQSVTTFVGVRAPASHFVVAADAANPAVAGAPFDITVLAEDDNGNIDPTYHGTVHFSSADPYGATLPDDYTFQPSDQGRVKFVAGAALYTAGIQDVTVTDTSSGITGTALVNVQAAPAMAFQLRVQASASSGTPFDVTVIAVDAYGNIDTNYQGTITFSTSDSDPGVVLPVDHTFQPGDQGQVTFSLGVTLVTPGDQTLTVTDPLSGIAGSALVTVIG
jgi:glucuronoarabinoxylan endo-1,4-beta-xylanase